jgi:Na+/phosphate symporter
MLDKAALAIQNDDKKAIAKVKELEGIVDEIYHAIDKFLDDSRFVNLNEKEFKKLAYLKHSLNDIERVGDHANNLAELAEKKMKRAVQFLKSHRLTEIAILSVIIVVAATGWFNSGLPKGDDLLASIPPTAAAKDLLFKYHTLSQWTNHWYLGYPLFYIFPSFGPRV